MVTKKECREIMSWATDKLIKACEDCPILAECNEYHFDQEEKLK